MNPAQSARSTAWSVRVYVVLALTGGFITEPLAAQDRFLVLRDGRKVPMVVSDTEIGLIMRRPADVKAATARLKGACGGELADVVGALDSPFKILHVSKATLDRRTLAYQDPAVDAAGKVYRFEGLPGPMLSTGKIALRLKATMTEGQRQRLFAEFGLEDVRLFEGLRDVYTATVGAEVDELLRAEELADDIRTVWAQPDFHQVNRPAQVLPSDPLFELQWHLNNTGQTDDGEVDADIDALEAWATANGEGVLFGMFDDSCNVDHEDLRDGYIGIGQDVSFLPGSPGADDPRPKRFSDFHGTAVMGLAVATGNSTGVRGVSFRSTFTASRGLGEFLPSSAIASAYLFAIAQGVDVHINSWGPVFPTPTAAILEDAIEKAFLEGRDPDGGGDAEPLGMVVVFSAGNGNFFTGLGMEIETGFRPSTLPTVLNVGASTDRDTLTTYSNFGADLNFVAPGGGLLFSTENGALIVTVDNDDETALGPGQNSGGFLSSADFGFLIGDLFGFPISQVDPEGKYTGFFNGTSAACPIAAGVAGLILSVNPQLTATDVRLVMEHTCDKISPNDANYNGLTSRSLRYGYGRINANAAALAAQESLTNNNMTWPDSPKDVGVISSTLQWRSGLGTDEFLVVQGQLDFNFIPEDGACYDASQPGCETSVIEPLPENVSVLFVGCTGMTECTVGSDQSTEFVLPEFGRQFLGIYGRNSIGRYSFGVAIDSEAGTTGGDSGDVPIRAPAVTIVGSPLEGLSPLTVEFNGNAVGDLEIDGNLTEWDFDVEDEILIDATVSQATHTYIVGPGESRKFTARLKMFDVIGNEGSASVQIRVTGPTEDAAFDESTAAEVSISVDAVNVFDDRCQTDVCGVSPFDVLFSINTVESNVALAVQSVVWDLGDGTTTASQSVAHTYVNVGSSELVLPVTATVTFVTTGGAAVPRNVTRLITVLPGTSITDLDEPNLIGTEPLGGGGTAVSPCGILTIVPLLGCFGGLLWLRRRA